MSTSSERELPPRVPQTGLIRLVISLVLALPLTFLAGATTQEPLAGAGIAAGVFSITVGVLVVAPYAGRKARDNFLESLANPTPRDDELMFRGTAHLIGKMGAIAESEKGRKLFEPLFNAYTVGLETSYQAIVNNIKSQNARGAGAFDPSQYSETEVGDLFADEVLSKAGALIDPFLDSIGVTERGKQIVHAKAMMALRGDNVKSGSHTGRSEESRGAPNPYSSQYHR